MSSFSVFCVVGVAVERVPASGRVLVARSHVVHRHHLPIYVMATVAVHVVVGQER